MEYRKEREFIVCYENDRVLGKWNILENYYIGVKGTRLKTPSIYFNINSPANHMPKYISNAIFIRKTYHLNPQVCSNLESLISLRLICSKDSDTIRHMEVSPLKLDKKLVEYLHTDHDDYYKYEYVQEYSRRIQFNKFIEEFSIKKERDWAWDCLRHVLYDDSIPMTFAQGMIRRGVQEKVYTAKTPYDFYLLMDIHVRYVNYMHETLEVPRNILTAEAILEWRYREYKSAHLDEQLKNNNDVRGLYYENDNFVIYPLLTAADFHDEATQQDNCVERLYMDKVARGTTYIVVVRAKKNPTKSYITCEVGKDGRIIQFLFSHNRRIWGNAIAEQLYDEYKNYLSTSLNTGE